MINFILGFLIGVCIAIPLMVLRKRNIIKAIKGLIKENKLLYLNASVDEFVNEILCEFENKLKKL